jgi:cytochrome b561
MTFRNTPDRYGTVARLAHWLTFLLLAGSFTIGFYMVTLGVSPARLRLFSYHKWIGVTIFGLVALRLAWRLLVPPPPLPAAMPAWEKLAADISHHLLYGCVIAMPLTGWLMSSAKGFQTVYFKVLPIPDLIGKNPPLGAALEEVHKSLAVMFLALIGLHVAAALKHHFVDRDDVLARMTPGVTPPSA